MPPKKKTPAKIFSKTKPATPQAAPGPAPKTSAQDTITSSTRKTARATDVLQAQYAKNLQKTRAKIEKSFPVTKSKKQTKSKQDCALEAELLELLEKKDAIAQKMVHAVIDLRKAYSAAYKDLDIVMKSKTSTEAKT